MLRGGLSTLAVFAALLFPAAARAGGPTMSVGTVEDEVLATSLVGAKANLALLKLAGFDSIRVTAFWGPTQTRPSDIDRPKFQNLAAAARLTGMRVYLNVRPGGSATTPLTEEARADFALYAASMARAFPAFRHFIVGNEPNLNRFWMPQFNEDGSNAAAPAYVDLLAETYDALKAVSRRITVIGGALAPRGIDRPGTGRDTHSPTKFIRDMGIAYRLSGRTTPVMDVFAIHPYGNTSSQAPIDSRNPRTTAIGIADYDKLVALLGEAFDGTAQPGSALPILYAEYGVETHIPTRKETLYTGAEPATTRPVDETTQATYYRQAIQLAFCHPNVRGILLLHAVDEKARLGWQSGVFYTDRTPKASLRRVAAAAAEARRGVVAACPGLRLTPAVRKVVWPSGTALTGNGPLRFQLQCSIDCLYVARLERVPAQKTRPATASGRLVGGVLSRVTVPRGRTAAGRYRVQVTLRAPVNAGRPRTLTSRTFTLGARTGMRTGRALA